MIRKESEGASFENMLEMSDAFEGAQKLSVVRRPLALVRLQFGAVECQGFPTPGTPLLQHSADGGVGGVGGES